MKLLKKYVLIKNNETGITKSGIILNNEKANKSQGTIQELGPDCSKELKKGQTVLYKNGEIQKYNILDDDYIIIDSDDIVAIFD